MARINVYTECSSSNKDVGLSLDGIKKSYTITGSNAEQNFGTDSLDHIKSSLTVKV